MIRGVYGEAKMLESMMQKYPDLDVNSINVNDYVHVFDKNGNEVNVMGVDLISKLNGRPFAAESKVFGKNRWDIAAWKKQLDKHLATHVEKYIDELSGAFSSGKVPILIYEIRGSFSRYADFVDEMIRHCMKNRKVIAAGFECESIFVGADKRGELLQPVVN